MTRIKTIWGEIELIASSVEMLCINGFCIPLDKKEEYVDQIPTPKEDIVKTVIEEMLKKNDFVEGKELKFEINCVKEDYGQEIAAFWRISFKMIKGYKSKSRKLRLVKLRYANSKENIPFKIEGVDVSIRIGKKWVVVPILTNSMVKSEKLSVTFGFLGCSLEGTYS
jgi:hypothetical protein